MTYFLHRLKVNIFLISCLRIYCPAQNICMIFTCRYFDKCNRHLFVIDQICLRYSYFFKLAFSTFLAQSFRFTRKHYRDRKRFHRISLSFAHSTEATNLCTRHTYKDTSLVRWNIGYSKQGASLAYRSICPWQGSSLAEIVNVLHREQRHLKTIKIERHHVNSREGVVT